MVSARRRILAVETRGPAALAAIGIAAFHLAFVAPVCAPAIGVFLVCLMALAGRLGNARRAFNWGVVIGLAAYVPHLHFFWNVFVGPAANALEKSIAILGVGALWMVLPVWLAVFLGLATWVRGRAGGAAAVLLAPLLWTGVEYFRSELYPLRFSWMGVGYAFAWAPHKWLLSLTGVYGLGFLLALIAGLVVALWRPAARGRAPARQARQATEVAAANGVHAPGTGWNAGAILLGVTMLALAVASHLGPAVPPAAVAGTVKVVGLQYEFAPPGVVRDGLSRALAAHPDAKLFVLPEHTFDGPVPQAIRDWCREHRRHLIAGGHDPLGETNFYNTAFVIGPAGEVVFQQAKKQPVQFFRDGVPAPEQRTWDSPWGRLGLCICYDLSYTRVTDELIRQGARALIVPTMDGESWGGYQHRLHARVAPLRAAEYGVPVFRVGSSGISQLVDRRGNVTASAPFPGQGEIIAGELALAHRGNYLLWDRLLAKGAVAATAVVALAAVGLSLRRRLAAAARAAGKESL